MQFPRGVKIRQQRNHLSNACRHRVRRQKNCHSDRYRDYYLVEGSKSLETEPLVVGAGTPTSVNGFDRPTVVWSRGSPCVTHVLLARSQKEGPLHSETRALFRCIAMRDEPEI